MEQRPIAERLQDIRALAREFGGLAAIPDEALAALDYIRHIDEQGDMQLTPAERLVVDSMAGALQGPASATEAIRREGRQPPFERLTLQIATKSNFVGAHPDDLNQKLTKELEAIQNSVEPNSDCGILAFLPPDSPALTFANHTQSMRGITESNQKLYVFDAPLVNYFFSPHVYDVLEAFEPERDGWYVDQDTGDRLSEAEAEMRWQQLERLKSRLADLDELEATFVSEWDEAHAVASYDHHTLAGRAAFHEEVGPFDPSNINHYPVTVERRNGRLDELLPDGLGFTLRKNEVVRVLRQGNFPDVADQLAACSDIPQIRTTLQAALSSNNLQATYKTAEKALLTQRRTLQSQDEINSFNAELHELRDAKKREMRLLRGAAEYFDLPRLFAQYVKARVTAVQNILRVQAQEGGHAAITLDARPDPKIDADAGRISGDCTNGRPLPFGTKLPAHNIKIYKEGSHVGNIYLLKTTAREQPATAEQPYPVWHLDAIQLPSHTISHFDFIAKLVAGLAEQATAQQVACITVNSSPHKISNYDYLSRAVLEYLGTPNAAHVQFDPELGDFSGKAVSPPAATVEVIFPAAQPDYSEFQGDTFQYILWRNPSL
ncbi:MAG TPA: hypothetical protein VLF91_02260 [Candidatus Saccharimonadales bacterium]|nr:hypothetical protein [Candidatus Saccharimonadales bacterium]